MCKFETNWIESTRLAYTFGWDTMHDEQIEVIN